MSQVPWFRFYHEALDDPKVQELSPEMFRHWVNCLCLAARNDGYIPCTKHVSFAFRVSLEMAQSIIDALVTTGLLDRSRRGVVRPHNWDERQFKSDTSTDRVKRFRERSRNGNETLHETNSETLDETDQSRAEQIPPIVPQGTEADSISYSPDFEIFWTAYPRKTGKGKAWQVWVKLKPSRKLQDQMLAAVGKARQSRDWQRDKGQFIPHPATWLGQHRWNDSTEPNTPGGAGLHGFL